MHTIGGFPGLLMLLAGSCALSAGAAVATPSRIDLDATQAPTGLLHSHLTFPIGAGGMLARRSTEPGRASGIQCERQAAALASR